MKTFQPSEEDFGKTVIELAQLYDWLVSHFRPGRTLQGWRTAIQGDKGFPDLVLVRSPRVIFAELKSERGRLTPEGKAWKELLEQCPGVEYYLWRPEDWEEIELVLRKGDKK